MTVLPIVGRELMLASRRAATYWLRFWVAVGAVLVFFVPFLNSDNSITEMGQVIFIFLASAMLLFSMLSGVFLTADSLAVEKREGTLGLLFLTDLKGYDVVLGKLAANSLQAFFGLLAVFPVLGLPLLTGGLSGGEFWRTMLVLTVTLYFSLSIGMLVSAASREGRQAMGRTLSAIMVLAGVLPLMWGWVNFGPQGGGHLGFLRWPSPVFAFIAGFDMSYLRRDGPHEYWVAIATLFSLAGACLIAACIVLPRSWQESTAADPAVERARFQFISEARRWRRPPLENKDPFFWLAMGDHKGRSAMNRMLILLGLLWGVALFCSAVIDVEFLSLTMFLAFGLHFAAKTLIATESGRRFHLDRQSGALGLLLVTPLPARDIVAGQREALWKQFQPALLLISIVNVATLMGAMLAMSGPRGSMNTEEFFMMAVMLLGGAAILWLDANALICLGMWRGLNAKKYPRSVLATLGQVLLPPWLALFFFGVLGAGFIEPGGAVILILFWFGVGVAIDIPSIAFAEENLVKSLRSVVSEGSGG